MVKAVLMADIALYDADKSIEYSQWMDAQAGVEGAAAGAREEVGAMAVEDAQAGVEGALAVETAATTDEAMEADSTNRGLKRTIEYVTPTAVSALASKSRPASKNREGGSNKSKKSKKSRKSKKHKSKKSRKHKSKKPQKSIKPQKSRKPKKSRKQSHYKSLFGKTLKIHTKTI